MIKNISFLDKNKKYNIFIVRTPFQLINAYEAKEYFQTKNNVLIIIDNGTENNKTQLTNLIYDDIWDCIIRFGDNEKTNFFNYVNLIYKLKKIKKEYLFIGSGFNKMQKILVANIDSEKTCFFDSGTNTMTTYKDFLESKINIPALKKLRFMIFGLKTNINKNIDFFTMFDLKELPRNKIFKNEYKFMKAKFGDGHNLVGDEIYIIGQRFVDADILDEEKYFAFLDNVIEKYQSHKINYLMHRTETKEYLINNAYDTKLNIIQSTMPGELFFLSLPNQPKYVIGTISTLIVSLKYILKNTEVIAYRFNMNDFKKNKDLYQLEYDNMRKNNILLENI